MEGAKTEAVEKSSDKNQENTISEKDISDFLEARNSLIYEDRVKEEGVIGWTQARISNVYFDNEDREIKIEISTPWAEKDGPYVYDIDKIEETNFSEWTSAFGLELEQYQELEGKVIWASIKDINIDSSGEISFHSRVAFDCLVEGPDEERGEDNGKDEGEFWGLLSKAVGLLLLLFLMYIWAGITFLVFF